MTAFLVAKFLDPVIFIGCLLCVIFGKKYLYIIISAIVVGFISGGLNLFMGAFGTFTFSSIVASLILVNIYYFIYFVFKIIRKL